MRWFIYLCCAVVASCFITPAQAQEQPAKSKIISVGLFKNGLAVVKQQIDVPGPGTYRLDDVPEPVHGSWWIEGGGVETSTEMREVESADDAPPSGALQKDLAGKNVTIHFKGQNKLGVLQGMVLKFEDPKGEPASGHLRFLILKTAKGRIYVDSSEISALEVEGVENKLKTKKAVLVLRVDKADGKPIIATYLTRGLAWASSYRVDISDPKNLKLELSAVIRNELADLKQAEVRLISGFPSVQFSHVTSPLAARATWAGFFNELTTGGRTEHLLLLQNSTSNSIRFQERAPLALNLAANPTGEGVDLHYQSIGKRTLAKGDALSLTVAQGKADYERLIEWIIPDNRDEHGRYVSRPRGEDDLDEPWDALRFKNPFTFPMTTSPAMVVSKGNFNGQRTCFWTNAGEETFLRITKSLSVRTRTTEQEIVAKNGEHDIVYVGGNRYRRATIAAEVSVNNHRAEDIKMLVRRRFSGELLSSEGNPKSMLREEGVYSVNKRNELTWTLALKGGEESTFNYRYRVLVSH